MDAGSYFNTTAGIWPGLPRFLGLGVAGAIFGVLLGTPLVWAVEPLAPAWALPQGAAALPDLPEAVTSFGAAVDGDWLYVYSGHIGETHQHSRDNLSRGFRRLNLSDGVAWEELGTIRPLQGLAMVSHAGKVYRIGGVEPRNAAGEPEDMHSVADFARFDPEIGEWETLPPLPEPRSSHDAAVLDGVLYVVGGWQLRGKQPSVWHETAWMIDLEAETPAWEPMSPPPVLRRAVAVATADGKVWVLGGIEDAAVQNAAFYYDTAVRMWSRGPDLPIDAATMGFAVAAFGVDGDLYVNGLDGVLYRLSEDAARWEAAGFELDTPRFFHRLQPHGDEALLFIAGSGREGHLADLEHVSRSTLSALDADSGGGVALVNAPTTAASADVADVAGAWPGFRGRGDSLTTARDLPTHWSAEENVGWIAELPGYGQSSPVVWGNRIFVTSVDGQRKDTLIVSAIDVDTGEVIWRRRLRGLPNRVWSDYVSKAAPTPAVDDERLYVFFESGDLAALDHDGNELWRRSLVEDYGEFEVGHGIGNSPTLTDDQVVVSIMHGGPSYLLAVDKVNGRNRWKADLPSRTAWSSPAVVTIDGQARILVNQNGAARAYDTDGELVWELDDIAGNTIASPSSGDGLIVFGSSNKGQSVAVRAAGAASAAGVTSAGGAPGVDVAWRADAGTDFSSPLIHGGCVFFVNSAGVVSCVDPEDGSAAWRHRIGDSCWASPLGAGENVYFFSKKGTTTVLRADAGAPQVVAQNPLPIELAYNDYLYGVAAVDGALLLRTGARLIRISTES